MPGEIDGSDGWVMHSRRRSSTLRPVALDADAGAKAARAGGSPGISAISRTVRRMELGYGDPRGTFALRHAVSTMLNIERGLATTANNILLTRGSQMALYLSARVLIRPGDAIVVDDLTW